MKKVFMRILDLANYEGDVIEANLYSGGEFASVEYETEKGEVFAIRISKKEKEVKADGN